MPQRAEQQQQGPSQPTPVLTLPPASKDGGEAGRALPARSKDKRISGEEQREEEERTRAI